MKRSGVRMTLYNNRLHRSVRIIGITGGQAVKRLLSDLGIRTGEVVRIKRNAPFGGPVLIERDSSEIALGREVAECILVEEAV